MYVCMYIYIIIADIPPGSALFLSLSILLAEAAMDFALAKNVRLFMAPEARSEISRDTKRHQENIRRTSRFAKICEDLKEK